ncbi:truncated hemoglobin [Aliikangiella coralliicola]|uniref:Group 1 truncated hemoglobin n=1 Tax=Aliikangiella coralliicola TaxID=2592383 RepID=A0A545U8Z7_9GAMM|nr:group 1 truncated hemoglobin [Aliikangiella coralliicola]TQV85950.1 group 1 truncated hemoglobin [Aliikangiella coralliicola]
MNSSLFARIGSEATVEAAVNRFYSKFLQYDDIKPLFDGVDINNQKKKLRQFFTVILRGQTEIPLQTLIKIHKPLVRKGLRIEHARLWLSLTEETLHELHIPPELIDEFMELCEPYKRAIYSLLQDSTYPEELSNR